ncbi:biopolymer transporter ExbD [Pseudorhodoferax sp. Leaf265]|jgi:biopolymer transport protein ExbD|uniref:ExbD/TolR family protein n=1 Tax=Pseudorhodoferax sp. Leaf265 TaxID=1736315 RepID=UPI0006F58A76|nr:biopolymer transporter ExbD [Pseudorhodoferax sp. Leaf265]KQP02286.1 biopolymer transporter ExbD [Pseudorhodoferax sp. Leaf265]PZP94521.1 MAG: biopolymer transporter ExbD [Variovorax paradoxus]PZQ05104.1 MAG: biopolymer transporter ExbD [Variovorax paradoxus]
MNFRRRGTEEPEINLIPFIDVLLVVLIFLMLSTTYSKYAELQVRLPLANAEAQRERPREVVVSIAADGRYAVDRQPLDGRSVELLVQALLGATKGVQEPLVVISADASTPHQAVITAMDAARRAGLQQLTFATQRSASGR